MNTHTRGRDIACVDGDGASLGQGPLISCRVRKRAAGLIAVFCLVLGAATAAGVAAATSQPADPSAAAAADHRKGEELLLFEAIPVVVSASRQGQPANWLSVPVSVLTAEDIHYSGLTNVAEVLQFVPGVDVLRADRNTYAVGIRGQHSFYSDRLLALIDGRPVNSLAFGGVEWIRLPVLMEDIKSIEVVRGPVGATWGANAINGAVNIITKDPEDVLGAFASTTVNQFGDTYNHVRWAERIGKWSYRVSAGYQNRTSSEDAIHDDDFSSRDFGRDWIFDAKAIYRPSDETKLTVGGSYVHEQGGDYEVSGYWPRERSWFQIARSFARLDRKFSEDVTGYVQWFGQYAYSSRPQYCDTTKDLTNDLEGQLNFVIARNHQVSVGGNVRWVYLEYWANRPDQIFMDRQPFQEYWVGLFAMDRWQVTDRLVLEGQLRGDWYSAVQTDWSGRVSALYALDAKKDHVVRLSSAKAFRSPAYAVREGRNLRFPLPSPPLPPGLYGYNLLKPDLVNEELWTIEAGYTGKLADGLTLRIDPYYQRHERLIGNRMLTDPLGLARVISKMDNIDGADAYGTECELALSGKMGKLSLWYAYNDFVTDRGGQSIKTFYPAKHKAGLAGRLFLPRDWTLNVNYKYSDLTENDTTMLHSARMSHRLDIGIAKEVFKGRGEVMIGVNDVLNTTDSAVYEVGALTAHDTPGRTLFIRLQVSL